MAVKTKKITHSKSVAVAVLGLISQLVVFLQGETGMLAEITNMQMETLVFILGTVSVLLMGLLRIFDVDSKISI